MVLPQTVDQSIGVKDESMEEGMGQGAASAKDEGTGMEEGAVSVKDKGMGTEDGAASVKDEGVAEGTVGDVYESEATAISPASRRST